MELFEKHAVRFGTNERLTVVTSDSYMLAESQLLPQLEDLMPREPGVEVSVLYGDPAYPQSRYIVGGYRNADSNSVEARWNTAMSKVRDCV
jgi:hypothetical protein